MVRQPHDAEFKAKKAAQEKLWREANPEHCKAYKAEQYQENREEIDAKNEAWEKANPERTRELKLASFHRHKDEIALRVSAKKAEEQKAHDDLTIAKIVDPNVPAPVLQQVLATAYEKRVEEKKEYMREYMREYEQRPERKEYMREYYQEHNAEKRALALIQEIAAAIPESPAVESVSEEKIDSESDGRLSQAKPITSEPGVET